ncbi:MAG: LptF/LptG family permease [Simkaniaceae bacterium]|nr:LptF/LptG family permease [Simkaniaceae bacterium]
MTVLWRYLLRQFFQVFALCVSIFICVLLVLRFQDLARFATLGTSGGKTVLFILLQIPEILPIAIPISALISSTLLMQRLSDGHVLTMVRAAGLSLSEVLFPLKAAGLALTLCSFIFTAQLTPYCRRTTKVILFNATMTNPLLLLKKNRLFKIKDSYLEMDMIRSGEKAERVLFAFKNPSNKRINLITAKQLRLNKEKKLLGNGVSMIHHINTKEDQFDHLLIDNQKHLKTDVIGFTSLTSIKKSLSNSEMELYPMLKKGFTSGSKEARKSLNELCKRLSFAFIAFGFTFLGSSYGIRINRGKSRRSLIIATALCIFTFTLFLVARSLSKGSLLGSCLYLIPHPLLYYSAWRNAHRISRGMQA